MSREITLRSLLILCLAGCGSSRTSSSAGGASQTTPSASAGAGATSRRADGRLSSEVVPAHYALSLTIAPTRDRFEGIADIDVELGVATRDITLHAQHLDVRSAQVEAEGRPAPIAAEFAIDDAREGVATLHLSEEVGPGRAQLHLEYSAPFDAQLDGLYRVRVGEDTYAFTQFEPVSARKAFPCFDEPGWKTPYDVTITAPADQNVFANSAEVESAEAPEGMKRTRFATTEALPTYLIAWAVGPLDSVSTTVAPNAFRSTPLTLRGVAPRGRSPELAYAMEHTPKIVEALESYFEIAYPFDKLDVVAVPDFSAGAMENAGLVTFRDSYLLLSADAPVAQRRGFAFVMAHELAHQWFGNLVTMAWWDDLWLNEAFATWMETSTVARVFPEMRAEVSEMMTALEAFDADSLATARQIRNPIASTHDVHNAFDSITYSKGASVLNMFESYLGSEVFRRGVQRYLHQHARRNATAADLINALSEEARRDVRPAMESFLLQPGIPQLAVAVGCANEGPATLTLSQSRYVPHGSHAARNQEWRIPVCVRYRAGGTVHESCSELSESSGEMSLAEGCPDWVLPNVDGNGYYRWTLEEPWLAKLRSSSALSALSVREQLSYADSVRSGFTAGTVPYTAALQALEPLATSNERFVATAPIELLAFARDHVLHSETELQAFSTYAARLYREQARRLGWGPRGRAQENDETRLLRAAITSFLALTAKEPALRREAERRGRAYVGLGARQNPDQIHPEAVPSDLVDVSVIVAAQEGGEAYFELLDRLFGASQDTIIRNHLLAAMSSVDDEPLRARALALPLDPRLRINEVFRPLMGQMSDPDGRAGAWTWLTENYARLAGRVGPAYAGFIPYGVSGFCSTEDAARIREFLEPKMRETEGGPRNLEAALETVELCAARLANQEDGVRAFFANPRR